jgi:hypothetical protein
MSKKILTTTVTGLALTGVLLAGTTFAAGAQTQKNTNFHKHKTLTAAQIASLEAKMTTNLTNRLNSDVTNGKITSTQEAYILNAESQIFAKFSSGDKAGAKTLRQSLDSWLKTQGIATTVFSGHTFRARGGRTFHWTVRNK